MWIKNPGLLGKPIGEFRVPSEVDWVTANRACKELKFAGYSDWRLPTVPDWEKLCDEIPNVFSAPLWGKPRDDILNVNPEQYLEECLNRWYWTSSESKHKPKEYYAVVNGFGEFQSYWSLWDHDRMVCTTRGTVEGKTKGSGVN